MTSNRDEIKKRLTDYLTVQPTLTAHRRVALVFNVHVAHDMTNLIEELERLEGQPCSICGKGPAVCMDAAEKGSYWLCGKCASERCA